jgi:hypothetical protein
MSRTKRKLHPRTRQWILKPRINPLTRDNYHQTQRSRRRQEAQLRGDDGVNPSETRTTLNCDREGNTKKNGWCLDWTGSHHVYRRYVNRIQRAANKLKINHGIQDHFDALEDHGHTFNWRGESDDEQDMNAWYDSMMEEYDDMLEEERRQEEFDRQYAAEMDAYWDDLNYGNY